ncbi:MAG: hypothetical protein AUG51_18205 [Acidobacteria bacterium 13_1_20CM_3_53_8]|nr:MAG: hypothetical protein AUG51_18205 [Acidobacteria bacterium 13_1_20CM_3_53_8]
MNSDNTIPSRGYLRGTAMGSFFLTAFSLFWALGAILSFGIYQLLFSLIVAAVSLVLAIAAVRLLRAARSLPESVSFLPVKGRAFKLAVIFEAVAIPVSVGVLSRIRRFEYILPVIALIVGLHFFAMLPTFKERRYLIAGVAICLLAVLTVLFLPQTMSIEWNRGQHQFAVWSVVVGFGCTVILWLCAASGLVSASKRARLISKGAA